VVKQHGGFLHVYSEPGQSSLFRIYSPAMPGSVAESSSVAVHSVSEMRGSETVLIADDHQSIREMARQTLASLGYRVLCAADGEEALRLYEQNTPQIAVSDLVMARLGGTATADWLLERFPGSRVIFATGYSRDRDERTRIFLKPRICRSRTGPQNWEGWCGTFWTRRRSRRTRETRMKGLALGVSRLAAAKATLGRASAAGT
jgi:CheY-like chemotaxis protein